jgi:hypothetical protein
MAGDPAAGYGARAMVFRDENETLRARVGILERELAEARAENARLRNDDASGASFGTALAGGPLRLSTERELAGETPPEAHEQMVEELRQRYGRVGQVSTVGRTFAWSVEPTAQGSGRAIDVTVTSRDGRTVLRGRERLGTLAGALFGGLLGGVGGSVAPVLGVLLGRYAGGVAAAVGAVGWVVLVFLVVRAMYAAMAQRRRRALQAAIDELAAIAAASHTRRAEITEAGPVRVELPQAQDELSREALEPMPAERAARRSRG